MFLSFQTAGQVMMIISDMGAQKVIRSTKTNLIKWLKVYGECFDIQIRPFRSFVAHKDRAITKFKTSCMQLIELLVVGALAKQQNQLPVSTVGVLTMQPLLHEWGETKSKSTEVLDKEQRDQEMMENIERDLGIFPPPPHDNPLLPLEPVYTNLYVRPVPRNFPI